MKPNDVLRIAILPGDGIGAEVLHAALPIIKALNVPALVTEGDIGWSYWQTEGNPIPERTWKLIDESDTVLLGAITSKPEREARSELAMHLQKNNLHYLSPIIQLRQKLDLFANVRPCFAIKDEGEKYDFCIIRENTEGLYSGFDYYPTPEPILNLLTENQNWHITPGDELSCSLRLQTKKGLTRLFEYAFNYAEAHQMKRVTFADKPNVLRQSSGFARLLFEQVSAQHPQIQADILNVDAVALWMIRRPEEFGVIVAENMFGDILSDVGAGVMGGLGFAPSANIGLKKSYFEPVHGSAPRVKSNGANPSAMFLTIGMMLENFGFTEDAKTIISAVTRVVKEKHFITYDLGGNATTEEMAHAIIDSCLCNVNYGNGTSSTRPVKLEPKQGNDKELTDQLQKLRAFSTAELSDALDAYGIEGALLDIKPLSNGTQLIGPAYTVKFALNAEKPDTFRNAANYIDSVPEQSVIVIDNEGRKECTAWGGLLTQMAMQKNIAGTVVHGAIRDAAVIRQEGYPVYSTDVYMRSGKNRIHKISEQCTLTINSVTINPGDIIVADDNGVLVIPRHLVDDIIIKARNIQCTEKNISCAIKGGSTLEQARVDCRYDQPWLGSRA